MTPAPTQRANPRTRGVVAMARRCHQTAELVWKSTIFVRAMVKHVAGALAVALIAGGPGCRQKRAPAPTPEAPVIARTPVVAKPLPADLVSCVETEVAAGFAAQDQIVENCLDAV